MDVAFVPRCVLERIDGDPERRVHWNVLLSHFLLAAAALVVVRLSFDPTRIPHVCLFQWLFGIPCPGCGITWSILAFLSGNSDLAWALNPVGPALCVGFAAQIPLRVLALCGGERWSRRVFKGSRAMGACLTAALAAVWIGRIV